MSHMIWEQYLGNRTDYILMSRTSSSLKIIVIERSTLGWPSNSFSSSGLRKAAVAMTAMPARTSAVYMRALNRPTLLCLVRNNVSSTELLLRHI